MSTDNTVAEFQLEDLAPYVGKTVVLKFVDGEGEEVEKTGEIKNLRLDLADQLVFFNPRGRGVPCLIEGPDVRGFRLSEQSTRLRLVTQRVMSAPKAATIRRHLADAHGWPLEKVNSMGDEAALAEHDKIDHMPLGHNHAEAGLPTGESSAMQSVPAELRDRVNAASRQMRRAG